MVRLRVKLFLRYHIEDDEADHSKEEQGNKMSDEPMPNGSNCNY